MEPGLIEKLNALSKEERTRLLTKVRQAREASDKVKLARTLRADQMPLSFAQERMWFLTELDPDSAAYNSPFFVRADGTVLVAALEQVLTEIQRRHEALRSAIRMMDGRPVQSILPPAGLALPVVDLSGLGPDRGELGRALAALDAVRPLDLAYGEVMRSRLIRLEVGVHLLLCSIHHIASDGWSRSPLFRELVGLYECLARGEVSLFPELPVQYPDYAVWQRRWLTGNRLKKKVAYWRDQLLGAPPVLEFPLDHPRPVEMTYRGARQRVVLSPTVAAVLEQMGKDQGATLYMVFLSALSVLLMRWSSSTDLCIGSPIAGRDRKEIEDLIGVFVNTLVMRINLTGNPSFPELLGRVRKVTLDAYANQELPFERLVDEIQPVRTRSHSPVFQVMFVLQSAPGGVKFDLPGMTLSEVEKARDDISLFDLDIWVWRAAAGLSCEWTYNADLFESSTISRMLEQWKALLRGIVAAPDRPIWSLPLLGEAETAQLLWEWNDTAVDYRVDKCLDGLFGEQAARTSDHVALVFDDQHLTYGELAQRVNHLARCLRELGVGPDNLVGLCADRSLEMEVGVFGILAAGAAYVPIDPSYPPVRLQLMLADAQLTVVLTQSHLADRLRDYPGRLLLLDGDLDAVEVGTGADCYYDDWANRLAYMIYTSGSTGRPKGVLNGHAGIRNRLIWMQEQYQLDSTDRVLQKTPFTFDVSVWELCWPLLYGSTTVMALPEGHKDPGYQVNTIEREQITTIHFVPTMLQVFVDTLKGEQCRSLRRVICSGEVLPKELQDRFLDIQQAALENLYGPTEAAVDVTRWGCRRDTLRQQVAIGYPIANTMVQLRDRDDDHRAAWVGGELMIQGVQLARGYLNRADLTADRFVATDASATSGERAYRTGDLARMDREAAVDYLGRLDFQVKVRGFRIELGEIETLLAKQPGVREVLVLAAEYGNQKRLVAYVVPRIGQQLDTAAMRQAVSGELPDYMVPSAFMVLDHFPLTTSGKVNRKALPAPETRASLETGEYLAPRTTTERHLADIWAKVLGLDRVGVEDNFFSLGGHSLLAATMYSHLQKELDTDVPLRQLFETPTIAGLARAIDLSRGQRDDAPALIRGGPTATDGGEVPHATFERRDLGSLIESSQIPPADAAVLKYLPRDAMNASGLTRDDVVVGIMGGRPAIWEISTSPVGRLATIMLPRFSFELMQDIDDARAVVSEAFVVARRAGASVVGLTGHLQTAVTDFGLAVAVEMAGGPLPRCTTTSATQLASVLLALDQMLSTNNRSMGDEVLGLLGGGPLTSVLSAAMLKEAGKPKRVLLCDCFGDSSTLEHEREQLRATYPDVPIEIAAELGGAPSLLFDATVIVTATSAPGVLDVARFRPGTMILAISKPPFDLARAQQRMEKDGDVVLGPDSVSMVAPWVNERTYFLPPGVLGDLVFQDARERDPAHVTSCEFSSLLSAKCPECPTSLGLSIEGWQAHLKQVRNLGLTSRPLIEVASVFFRG